MSRPDAEEESGRINAVSRSRWTANCPRSGGNVASLCQSRFDRGKIGTGDLSALELSSHHVERLPLDPDYLLSCRDLTTQRCRLHGCGATFEVNVR